jgi:hypothetical protein
MKHNEGAIAAPFSTRFLDGLVCETLDEGSTTREDYYQERFSHIRKKSRPSPEKKSTLRIYLAHPAFPGKRSEATPPFSLRSLAVVSSPHSPGFYCTFC